MRFYTKPHQFYCGIDLHARLLAVCIVDASGNIVLQKQLPAEKQLLLDVYPRGLRETRDLLRRRMYFVQQRAALITHVQIVNAQYNLPEFSKKLIYARNRAELKIAERFDNPQLRKSVEVDLALIDVLDERIAEVELHLERTAKVEDPQTFHLLKTIGGVGKILGLTLLYEIHDIGRFPDVGEFLSYARLVRCRHESAGKKLGSGGHKIGNAHLKWAFSEAVCLLVRHFPVVKTWQARREKKHGKKKTLGILAARLGRTVYHMLRKREAFDVKRFLGQ